MGKTSTHPHARPAMVAAPAGKAAALAAMAAALALAAAPSSVSADDYRYIVSGWPAANASHSANSAACAPASAQANTEITHGSCPSHSTPKRLKPLSASTRAFSRISRRCRLVSLCRARIHPCRKGRSLHRGTHVCVPYIPCGYNRVESVIAMTHSLLVSLLHCFS